MEDPITTSLSKIGDQAAIDKYSRILKDLDYANSELLAAQELLFSLSHDINKVTREQTILLTPTEFGRLCTMAALSLGATDHIKLTLTPTSAGRLLMLTIRENETDITDYRK